MLIELSFGMRKKEGEECNGFIKFFEGKKYRIINLDETDGLLDNTSGQRGEIPDFVFYSNGISGGSSRGNKISYWSIIIVGSNAAGEPLPLHFQLKTLA